MASDSYNGIPQFMSMADPYEALGFTCKPDGSLIRNPIIPFSPATPDPDQSCPVLSKDIPLNQSNNTWVRIYLPKEAVDSSPPQKLPLIVYYHGGGFVVCSAGSTMFQEFCTILAVETKSVIVSVEYRLAPEHRLPAAYDDCVEALHWIKTTQDEWLTKYGDLSNCFLMGISAGANIVYHVGLRAISAVNDLQPLKIKGLIMQDPFFGAVERTKPELKSDSRILSLSMSDLMWELSLPAGADRDHEYCNPMKGDNSSIWDEMKRLGWKIMVTGCDGDPLIHHQIAFANLIKGKGIDVITQFREGFYHGYELADTSIAKESCGIIMNFMTSMT